MAATWRPPYLVPGKPRNLGDVGFSLYHSLPLPVLVLVLPSGICSILRHAFLFSLTLAWSESTLLSFCLPLSFPIHLAASHLYHHRLSSPIPNTNSGSCSEDWSHQRSLFQVAVHSFKHTNLSGLDFIPYSLQRLRLSTYQIELDRDLVLRNLSTAATLLVGSLLRLAHVTRSLKDGTWCIPLHIFKF